MNIVFLDRETMGLSFDPMGLSDIGDDYQEYPLTDSHDVVDRCKNANVIVTTRTPLPKNVLEHCPDVSLIVACAVGVNHIDVQYCKTRDIAVANCPGYSTQTVAQHTLAMALGLFRQMNAYREWVAQDRWRDDLYCATIDAPIRDLQGQTWGIVGLGNIGLEVARLAESFGCNIVFHSTSGQSKHDRYPSLDLHDLMKQSSVVSIHCPLNEQTSGLIDQEALSFLASSSVLINVARGPVVDEKALAEAFDQKNLFLGLDVITQEPLGLKSPLHSLKNHPRTMITPHVAWTSVQARKKLSEMVQHHIQTFMS